MKRQLPPHNERAERNVVGALLIDPLAHISVSPILSATDFYIAKNGILYDVIDEAAHNGGVDVVTVANILDAGQKLEQIGGMAYLTELIGETVDVTHVERHAEIVRECSTRRSLIRAATAIAQSAWKMDTNIDDVQSRAQEAVMGTRLDTSNGRTTASDMAQAGFDCIENWHNNPLLPGQTRGLATGIRAIDKALGGLESAVYIIAGRPSMGKTAMILQMIEGIAGRDKRCLLFTLEMSVEQVTMRMATSLAEVELETLKQGRAGDGAFPPLMNALGLMSEWPLTIIDRAVVRPADILAEIRREQIEHGELDAVFVDGLWLMTPTRDRENRTQSLGATSREIKRVQRETNIPLVLTHQLNRGVENRNDKRPVLADLRDTGDIEQDADVVGMLYRDDYYDPDSELVNIAEFWIRKNRLGGRAGIKAEMFWKGAYMRFLEAEQRSGDVNF